MVTKPTVRKISTADLTVDPAIQRALDMRRVQMMVDTFNPDAVGTITVSQRKDGTHVVIDGQHRVEAVRYVDDNLRLDCRVFVGLTKPEEAKLFRLLNTTKKPSALDLFRARLIECEPIATEINNIIIRHGFEVGYDSDPRVFAAVGAAEKIYKQSPEALDATFAVATNAWGYVNSTAEGRVIHGLGLLLIRDLGVVDLDVLVTKLAKYPGGPAALIGNARGLQAVVRGKMPDAIAELVIGEYNRGRREGYKLKGWRTSE